MKTARRQRDLTEGNLLKQILCFMLPLVATNLLQQFYHAADVMIVGLSTEPDAVGAVGATGTFLTLIRNIFIGFSVGSNVVVARAIGRKDKENVSRAVHTAVCMAFIFGTLGSVVGILLTRFVLVGMGYTGTLLTLGMRYAYIYLACLPALALTNFLCSIFQAQGNTGTTLKVLTATGILNVALNLLFVLVFGMSVEGVAIATAIANLVSAVVLWGYLARYGEDCRISFKKLRVYAEEFREIVRIGLPAGIQSSFFSLSNLLIQSSILEVNNALTPAGSAYAPVVKGSAAAGSIEGFLMTALNAATTTASAFTAQNAGAGNYRRLYRAFWLTTLVSAVVAIVLSSFGILFRNPLLALYGVRSSEDLLGAMAYDAAIKRIFVKWPALVLISCMNAFAGTIRGLGKSVTSATVNFFGTCVFRVLWIYTAFRAFPTIECIFASYGISWFLTGAVFLGIALYYIRKGVKEKTA